MAPKAAVIALIAVGMLLVLSDGQKQFHDICDQVHGALGYPCEHNIMTTDDGFELDVIHIPAPSNGSGYPVILQHGLLDDAITWVANYFPHQNLACLLHDAGYDVWMPNSRGNHYSMGNTKYLQSESTYWRRIDMDGMAKYDMPTVIDGVLNRTGKSSLTYVGHSQGTWMAFSAFGNVHPHLASKVDLFVGLAPVAYVAHTTSFLVTLLADLDVGGILELFGDKDFLANDWLINQFAKYCKDLGELCPDFVELLCGDGNPANTNRTQLGVITRYDPGGTSVNNMVHWQQEVVNKDYAKHDYGLLENEKLYGQATAPRYHLSTMQGPPTALFSGSRDALADPTDVATLLADLPNSTVVQHTVIDDFAHLDFTWGLDAASKLYNPYVLPLIAQYKGHQARAGRKP